MYNATFSMQTTGNVHSEPTGCQNVARHLFKNCRQRRERCGKEGRGSRGQTRSGQPRAGAAGQRQVTSFLLEPRAASCVAWPVVRAALVVVACSTLKFHFSNVSVYVSVCVCECVCIEEIKIINKLNKSM